jgi:hypothetical protein
MRHPLGRPPRLALLLGLVVGLATAEKTSFTTDMQVNSFTFIGYFGFEVRPWRRGQGWAVG